MSDCWRSVGGAVGGTSGSKGAEDARLTREGCEWYGVGVKSAGRWNGREKDLVPFGGGGAVKVFRPFVVCVADVWLGQVSGVRWGVHVVPEELAVERVGSDRALLEAQGLEVKLHLTLQDAELGGYLVIAFGAGEQRCVAGLGRVANPR